MDDDEYIKQRVDNQKAWYSKQSGLNQKWHKWLQVIQVLSAACIPFLASYVGEKAIALKIIVGALGVLIAVITGVVAIFKFEEKWLKYRTTAESLKHEKFLYLTKTQPYDGDDAFHLLVGRVEGLISQENRDWAQFSRTERTGTAKEK